jgi:heme/copper-type cytochrome/quinol oxidase subunit 2
VVPSDPALVSPDTVLRSQHASNSVFVLPLVLLVVLALLVAFVVFVRKRRLQAVP